ncbi:hypothetical protein BDR26DRAFT_886845, partial [Obelidium mucronatum]
MFKQLYKTGVRFLSSAATDDEWKIVNGVFVKVARMTQPPAAVSAEQSLDAIANTSPAEVTSESTPIFSSADPMEPLEMHSIEMDQQFSARQNKWKALLGTLEPVKTMTKKTYPNRYKSNEYFQPIVRAGDLGTNRLLSKSEPTKEKVEKVRQTSIEFPDLLKAAETSNALPSGQLSWRDSLDTGYKKWTSSAADDANHVKLSTFLKTYSPDSVSTRELVEFAAPLICPKRNEGPSPLIGLKPAHVWQLYSIVSNNAPSLLNALTSQHWSSIIRSTVLSFFPTNPAIVTIPEFLGPMLQKCSNRIVSDKKYRGVSFTAETYAALYKAHYGDPRKAIAVHEIARSNAATSKVPLITDESIRIFLGVLLYGGGPEFRMPDVHIQRSGPILAYRTNSSGTKPTLVDVASVVEDLWQDMEDFVIRPSQDTYLAFLEAFAVFGEKNMVEKVHKRLTLAAKRKNGMMDDLVYKALMDAHEKCGNFTAVTRLFDSLEAAHVPFDISIVNANLRCLFNIGQFETLLNCFHRIAQSSTVHPTDETIDILLCSLVKFGPQPEIASAYLTAVNKFLTATIDFSSTNRPINLTSYVSLITSACSLSNLTVSQSAYTNMKANLMLRNSSPTSIQTFTSRKAISPILRLLAKTNYTLEPALGFFRRELLTKERVMHHWVRINAGVQKQFLKKKEKLCSDLDNPELYSSKRLKLETALQNLEELNEKGLDIRVGRKGPFSECYEALELGAREGLESRVAMLGGVGIGSGLDRGDELMLLSDSLAALEKEEFELAVLSCEEGGVAVNLGPEKDSM